MKQRIHIMGASGSGTTTLGSALSKAISYKHLDSDDYFWTTKFTEQRAVADRKKRLEEQLFFYDNWILSGAICGWGDKLKEHFDLVIFLWIPQDLRLERLKQREFQRYGDEILIGGSKYEQSKSFLEWASLYDNSGVEVRSKTLHEQWIADLHCPLLKIEGDYTVNERLNFVLNYLNSN